MAWLFRQIRSDNPTQQSFVPWDTFASQLLQVLTRRNVEKIELVSFSKKGNPRTLRWLLPTTDVEYCTQNEALNISKKLAFLMLNSSNAPMMTQVFSSTFPPIIYPRQTTRCPVCKKEIDISDFDRDGRVDPESIQVGHEIPLSRAQNSHNSNNIFWIHRRCNYIKGEQTIKESLLNLIDIIKNHLI